MLCSLEFWANKLGEAVHLFSTLKRGRVEFAAPCQAARPVDIPAAPSSLPHIFHHPARPRLEPAHQRAAAAAALALDPLPKTCSTPAPARESSTFLFYPQQPPSSHHSPPDPITIFRLAGRRNEKRDPHAVSFARPRHPTTNEHSPRPTTTRPAPASRLPPPFLRDNATPSTRPVNTAARRPRWLPRPCRGCPVPKCTMILTRRAFPPSPRRPHGTPRAGSAAADSDVWQMELPAGRHHQDYEQPAGRSGYGDCEYHPRTRRACEGQSADMVSEQYMGIYTFVHISPKVSPSHTADRIQQGRPQLLHIAKSRRVPRKRVDRQPGRGSQGRYVGRFPSTAGPGGLEC